MQLTNGTSHKIVIYLESDASFDSKSRKLILNPGAQPIATIPEGSNLNAQKTNLPAPDLQTNIPLVGAVVFTSYDPIPENGIVVVSNLYRSAVKEMGGDTSRLATINGAVYDSVDSLRPVGCIGLAVG